MYKRIKEIRKTVWLFLLTITAVVAFLTLIIDFYTVLELLLTVIFLSAIGAVYIWAECRYPLRSSHMYDLVFSMAKGDDPNTILGLLKRLDEKRGLANFNDPQHFVFRSSCNYLREYLIPEGNIGGIEQRFRILLKVADIKCARTSETYIFLMRTLVATVRQYPVYCRTHDDEKTMLKVWAGIYVDSIMIHKDEGVELRDFLCTIALSYLLSQVHVESFVFYIHQGIDNKIKALQDNFADSQNLIARYVEEKAKITKDKLLKAMVSY